MCTEPEARRANIIVSMEFTIESCVRESFVHRRWEISWLVCQHKEGDSNDVYAVVVKADMTKTVQIKCNNNLSSFQLHFINNFALTELQLAHGPVRFPARSISHLL